MQGELSKESAGGARGVQVIFLNNQSRRELGPEMFREAARRKALEAQVES